jgi:hypothetical protein
MLARFKARVLPLNGSAAPGPEAASGCDWFPDVGLILDGAAGTSAEKARPALRSLSRLLGGEGDLDLEIQDRLA